MSRRRDLRRGHCLAGFRVITPVSKLATSRATDPWTCQSRKTPPDPGNSALNSHVGCEDSQK
eukprot:13297626-Heterocapsa_arctica.AAC.1